MRVEDTFRIYRSRPEALARPVEPLGDRLPPGDTVTDNAIVHVDISGPHEAQLHAFYTGLLDWKVVQDPAGNALTLTLTLIHQPPATHP